MIKYNQKTVTYTVGQLFKPKTPINYVNMWVLSQVAPSKVALISLPSCTRQDSNRLTEAVPVEDINEITMDEFRKISSNRDFVVVSLKEAAELLCPSAE